MTTGWESVQPDTSYRFARLSATGRARIVAAVAVCALAALAIVTSAVVFAQSEPRDFDVDDDGLIDVSTLAQLNAIRWDADGDAIYTLWVDVVAMRWTEDDPSEAAAQIVSGGDDVGLFGVLDGASRPSCLRNKFKPDAADPRQGGLT